jgi:hypothetical protein
MLGDSILIRVLIVINYSQEGTLLVTGQGATTRLVYAATSLTEQLCGSVQLRSACGHDLAHQFLDVTSSFHFPWVYSPSLALGRFLVS